MTVPSLYALLEEVESTDSSCAVIGEGRCCFFETGVVGPLESRWDLRGFLGSDSSSPICP